VLIIAWAAEAIGVRSGYPFGSYDYTSKLQPQVMSVPILVPMAWLMMLPPSWAVARLITRKASGCLVRPTFVLVSALAFTAWDFYLDPQMVSWGMWEWSAPGRYFGIPWVNFLGWLIVSALITLAVSPKRLPGGLLVLLYALTWVVEFICQLIIWGLVGPALVGFFLMGGMLLWAVINTR
jgi:putative membrane protein